MKSKWRNILIALGLFLAVVLLIDFNRRMEELDRLTAKLEAVRVEGTAVMQTQVALITQVAYATSDDAVAQWAYQNKWVRAGEHPVELIPEGNVTPTPESQPVTQTEIPPTWRIWWELFFDGN
ncbi:MAG: hypothetical protein ABIF04_01715 [Chloroflexota bacterium]